LIERFSAPRLVLSVLPDKTPLTKTPVLRIDSTWTVPINPVPITAAELIFMQL
jgi:hypothetical protein